MYNELIMTDFGWIFTLFFVAGIVGSIWLTRKVLKRTKAAGCVSFGFVFLVIVCVLQLCIGAWGLLISTSAEAVQTYRSGTAYTAYVISTTTHESYDSEHNTNTLMHTPTVAFVLSDGDTIIKPLNFSAPDISIGDTYQVMYSAQNDAVITWGYTLIFSLAGSSIFAVLLSIFVVGIFLFASQRPMSRFWNTIKKVIFYFIIPSVMLGFEALLFWFLLYHSGAWNSELITIGCFTLVLGLAIVAYFKKLIQKGVPKMQQKGIGKWVGDWDNNLSQAQEADTSNPKDKSDKDNPFLIR